MTNHPGSVHEVDVPTSRLRTRVRDTGPVPGQVGTLICLHGNCSSSAFFHRLLHTLPPGWRGIAPDLRGYGETEAATLDATRGMRDFADDVVALMDALEIERAAFLGHSAGGGVVMQLAIDHPHRVAQVLLEAPASPYGFGGTSDVNGTPVWPITSAPAGARPTRTSPRPSPRGTAAAITPTRR